MITGNRIALSLFKSEEELNEYVAQYIDFESRSPFDHTELYSIPNIVKNYRESGLWSDSQGTMVIKRKNSSLIGTVSYRTKSVFELIVGYRIFKEENRGRGFGSEALSLFTRYLFMTKPIERITLEISSENLPSRKTAEKCGYTKEGCLRRAYFFRGKVTDMEMYGILRAEAEKL